MTNVNAKSWNDQPDCVVGCSILFSMYANGVTLEVRKGDLGICYLTAGTLFYSQTILCPNAEMALWCMNLINKNRHKEALELPSCCQLLEL
jgi:hypothetical protein